jgi:hypothetical protein
MSLIKKILWSILVFFLCLPAPGAVAGSEDAAPILQFRNKQFDPLEDAPSQENLSAAPQLFMRRMVSGPAYYIVQFDGPIQSEWKESLTALGATFFDYVPQYGFIIKADSAVESSIRETPHVRWLGKYTAELKISDSVYNSASGDESEGSTIKVRVNAFPGEDLSALSAAIENADGQVESSSEDEWGITLLVTIPAERLEDLAEIPGVKWIGPAGQFRQMNNVGSTIMQVRGPREKVWSVPNSKLFGDGQIIGICDSGIDTGDPSTAHDDFDDGAGGSRIIANTVFPGAFMQDRSGHGTHVAGSVLGNGKMSGADPATDDYPESCFAGIAPKARAYFQTVGPENGGSSLPGIPEDLSEVFTPAYAAGARTHTNSWGGGVFGDYDSFSVDVDQFAWSHKDFLILFSAGNSGIDMDRDGVIDAYSLTPPGTAKNCLTVGAGESLRQSGGYADRTWGIWETNYAAEPIFSSPTSDKPNGMAAFSSRGPTLDGRFKPEIMAPGANILSTRSSVQVSDGWGPYNDYYYWSGGTSMSTPLTAGTVLLLREYLIKQEGIANPSAALVKTALLHGATDVSPGQYGDGFYTEIPSAPNWVAGWGRVNLEGAVNADSNYSLVYHDVTSSAPEDSSYLRTFSMTVADDGKPFKATLGWSDYPGSEATAGTLVNDLDLRVQKPDGTWVYPDNANKGGALSIISYIDGTPDVKNDDEKVAIRVTPSSYPMQMESLMVEFANPDYNGIDPEEETGLSVVIYEWTGSGVGEELYRKKYDFVQKGSPLFPVGYAITEGEIVIAVEVESENVGVMVRNGNPSGRTLVWEEGAWATASFSAGMTAILRAAPSETNFDRVNNTVSVSVPDPEPGAYTVEVSAHIIPHGPQPYALVMSCLTTAVPTSGNSSVSTNPGQPDAPTVTISNRTRSSKTKYDIESETGVMLDEIFGGLVEFSGTITGNYGQGLVSMRYAVTGLPARKAGAFSLKKLLGGGSMLDFTYPKMAEYADGNWWLADAGGEYIDADRMIDQDGTYYVVSVIKDNGPYDANPVVNIVEDPQVLSGSGGVLGGGCTVGGTCDTTAPLLLVAALCLIALRCRRRCR